MAYIGQRPVIGRYIKLDQISSGFNGSNTGFSMTAGSQAVFPGTARNLLLSLGGVIQEPDTDFTISGSTLTFTTPPVANTTFFGVIYGDMQATGTPSDGTVLPASIASSGHFKIPQLTVNEDGANVDFRVEGEGNTNLLFVDASTDSVGIGLNNPNDTFHVFHATDNLVARFESGDTGGGITLKDNTHVTSLITTNGAFEINVDQGGDISGESINFKLSGSSKVFIDSSGRLLIGKTSTSLNNKLQVQAATDATAIAIFGRSADDIGELNFYENDGTTKLGEVQYRTNELNIRHRTQGAEINFATTPSGGSLTDQLTILANGQVGIGTSAPAVNNKLHLRLTNASLASPSTASTLLVENNGNAWITIGSSASSYAGILFADSGSADIGQIRYLHNNDQLEFHTNSAERMVIQSDGKVLLDRTVSSTSGNHPALEIETICSGSEDTTFATGIDFKVDGVFKKRLAVTNGSGEGGGNWVFYRDNGVNQAMTIDSSGRVGIGTSSPTVTLDLESNTPVLKFTDSNATGTPETEVSGAGGNLTLSADKDGGKPGTQIIFQTDGTTRMSLDSTNLNMNSTYIDFSGSIATPSTAAAIFRPADNTLAFSTANTERFRIDSAGDVEIMQAKKLRWVFAAGSTHRCSIGGEASDSFIIRNGSSDTLRLTIDSSGNIGAPSGTNIYNASDSRLKKNVVDLDKGLSAIKSLRPVSFNWIDGFCDNEKNTLYGFIAQEVQTVDTNLVQDFSESSLTIEEQVIDNPLRVNEKLIIPMLVKAVQELEAKVAALESA